MRYRYGVLFLLILLFAITYIDRVAISVAGPRIQADLGIDPSGWGWVTGMFTLAYCLFEIPTGAMGDRIGARRVLTRIVLWWSAFTALTGMVTSFPALLAVRFAFGAGEAGAFPNSTIVVSRWFPVRQRATISGVTLMAAQIGGALAPLLVVPVQIRYGWRVSFLVFAAAGIAWALIWYAWFRDSPAAKAGVSAAEIAEVPAVSRAVAHHDGMPWGTALRSRTVLAVLCIAFCYIYPYTFFQTWFHTFLVKGRGVSETGLMLSALPYVVAACCNLAGGAVSDALVVRLGLTWGRRTLGLLGLGIAGACAVGVIFSRDATTTVVLLSLLYGGITFQQAGVFGVCLDIGGRYAGSMLGLMNTTAQAGGFLASVLFGYIVEAYGYDAPFVPMAVLLFIGALVWTQVDASRPVRDEE